MKQILNTPALLTGGFSGDSIYRLPASILRLYCQSSEERNDARRNKLQRELSDATVGLNIVPIVYHNFGNGHIEEFIPGLPATFRNTENDTIFFNIAKKLALLHNIPSSRIPSGRQIDIFGEMYKNAGETYSHLVHELDNLSHSLLHDFTNQCICHNDLSLGNILVNGEDIRFIDCEMVDLNHPLYDISNFFIECTIDQPQYDPNYPSIARKQAFLTEYFKHRTDFCPTGWTGEYITVRINLFMAISHLYWALFYRNLEMYRQMRMESSRLFTNKATSGEIQFKDFAK